MSQFRRNLLNTANENIPNIEGLLFWFDSKDPSADNSYNLDSTTWKVKTDIQSIKDYSLSLQGASHFTNDGLYCIASDTTPAYAVNNTSIFYYLNLPSQDFTVEIACDLIYKEGSDEKFIYGSTYTKNGAEQWRGGFNTNNGNYVYAYAYNNNWYKYNLNTQVKFGKHIITIKFNKAQRLLSFFIDGEIIETLTIDHDYKFPAHQYNAFALGGYDGIGAIPANAASRIMNGYFHSFKFYNRQLTDLDIQKSAQFAINRYF